MSLKGISDVGQLLTWRNAYSKLVSFQVTACWQAYSVQTVLTRVTRLRETDTQRAVRQQLVTIGQSSWHCDIKLFILPLFTF